MKITALIPDDLIEEVKGYTKGKNITESLIKALSEWVQAQKIKKLNSIISKNPLKFRKDFSPEKTRTVNRSKGIGLIDSVVILSGRETLSKIWTLDNKLKNMLKKEEIFE